MKKDPGQQKRPATGATATATDRQLAQRNQEQNQSAPLSAANVEESPHMDRGDSAGGSGQSLGDGRDPAKPADGLGRDAVDTQYGTISSKKTGRKSGGQGGRAGRVASAGSGSSGGAEQTPPAPNPSGSEEAFGAERDTMTGSRPGGRS